MPSNYYMIFVAALIPLIWGSLYYSPLLAGKAWMKVNKFNEDDLKGANMALIFGITYVLSVFIAFALIPMVIHQNGAFSMMFPGIIEAGSIEQQTFTDLMAKYGDTGRSFSHGVIHGGINAVFFVFPLIAINALFERRGWKYIFIHTLYWLVNLCLMGGLLCATLKYAPLM